MLFISMYHSRLRRVNSDSDPHKSQSLASNRSLSHSDPRRAAAGANCDAKLHQRLDEGTLQMESEEDKEREVTLEDLPTHDL